MTQLSVTFWGVRGSLPSPGPATARYGGNTPCLEVRAGSELIILDMGSGLRALGDTKGAHIKQALFFLSHYHWDHIQGFPFFAPAYDPHCALRIYGARTNGMEVREILSGQMVSPYFPVPMTVFRAQLDFRSVGSGEVVEVGEARVKACTLNHPNGVLGYRVDSGGHSLVYATDTEHGTEADQALVGLAERTDLLIYDAMYTPEEYEGRAGISRKGWGHSTYAAAVDIARKAQARRLVLFHHDPSRADAQLEKILARARADFPDTILAREGETVEVAAAPRRGATPRRRTPRARKSA